jgi:amidase
LAAVLPARYGVAMTSTDTTARAVDYLVTTPATRLSALVQSGELHPLELLEAHLHRIDTLNSRLGAFVSVRAEGARAEAAVLAQRDDLAQLPLAGLPVAIKDNVDVAGELTRRGSRAVRSAAAEEDDELVRRLRAAGAVVVGKTTMPELAIWPVSEPEAFAPARNPWDRTRTPGGSSGGSAVAVTTGMVALALGSDGGGSLRIPAACCGIVGMKPAPGVVPLPGGAVEHWYGCSAFGPLARNVADAALMLDVLAGGSVYRNPVAPAGGLRISVSTKHPTAGARRSPEMMSAIAQVAAALEHAGHAVRRESPPYPATSAPFIARWLPGIAQDAKGLDPNELERRTRSQARAGRLMQQRGLAKHILDSKAGGRLREWLGRRDVLVAPVLAAPPLPIGAWKGRGWITTMMGSANWMGYTPPWNLAGAAAMTVPIGVTTAGLPIAVQLVAAPGREALLLSLGQQVEGLFPPRRWQPET